MYTKADLLRQIADMEIDRSGTVLIHSSMKAIGEVEGGADTVIDAWMEYMKDGLLIFPTHTWEEVGSKTNTFDVRSSPSCVGLLSNMFWKRDGVIRSLHPTHSVAAIGRDAASYIEGEETRSTPCPRNGCWGKLYDLSAVILFLGCTLRSNTFIHGVEEWNNIPDRIDFTKTQPLEIINSEGKNHHIDMHRHHCSKRNDISENYIKLEEPFKALNAVYYGQFGDAKCVVGNAVKMADITSEFLEKNQNLFLDDQPVPPEWYE